MLTVSYQRLNSCGYFFVFVCVCAFHILVFLKLLLSYVSMQRDKTSNYFMLSGLPLVEVFII